MLFLRSAAKCGVVKQGGKGCLELTLITNFAMRFYLVCLFVYAKNLLLLNKLGIIVGNE